ncbi:hypothetical protein [Cupriavidus metallidurans]|uniref:hypothetical protein n=1 Tax=Cupriavidus metallidurans TaxID=119219 RepID=UPI001CCD10B8|nr:hypothetical protein [Cupriavidus metallidurans]UBM12814.1 hypothetical protein LAI70_28075 [Cupriavidus metallidurans]
MAREWDGTRSPFDVAPIDESVRDLRMSEMTPGQRDDAHELWLRDQMAHMEPYYQRHLQFLLRRIDEHRAALAMVKGDRERLSLELEHARSESDPVSFAADSLRAAGRVLELYDDATSNSDYMIDSSDAEQILNGLADFVTKHGALPAPT